MAQIMEFLLNLLLLKGKFITQTAARTLHEAIRQCLKFKRKISMEYNSATNMACPFENMLEFINYNAREYRCEGENYVVTREFQCRLYEQLCKIKERQNPNYNLLEAESKNCQKIKSKEYPNQIRRAAFKDPTKEAQKLASSMTPSSSKSQNSLLTERPNDRTKKINEHLIDNLHAILKSQEILFKNITRLINLLENDEIGIDQRKLKSVKNKLTACTDILSNSVPPRTPTNSFINNIIEEEITRCRFRYGELKSLKQSEPEGLEVVLGSVDEKSPRKSADNIPKQIHSKSFKQKEKKPDKIRSEPQLQRKEVGSKDVTKKLKSLREVAIKLDKSNEILSRQTIDSEIEANAQKLKELKSPPVAIIQIEKENETFSREEINSEIEVNAQKLKPPYIEIIQLEKENETLSRKEINSEIEISSQKLKKLKSIPVAIIQAEKKNERLSRKEIDSEIEANAHKLEKLRSPPVSVIQLEKKNEMLSRKEINTEIEANSKKVKRSNSPSVRTIQLEKKNELLSRDEIDSEIKVSAQKLEKLKLPPAAIIQIEKKNETLSKQKIDAEIECNAENLLKNLKPPLSPTMDSKVVSKSVSQEPEDETEPSKKKLKLNFQEINNKSKIMEVNQQHFYKFEDSLWHSLTAMKYMSLKNDYRNMVKLAFYNKRHFLKIEKRISQNVQKQKEIENQEKLNEMNESVFKSIENKLSLEQDKENTSKLIELNQQEFDKVEGQLRTELALRSLIQEENKATDSSKGEFNVQSKGPKIERTHSSEMKRQEAVLKTIIGNNNKTEKKKTANETPVNNDKLQEDILKAIIGKDDDQCGKNAIQTVSNNDNKLLTQTTNTEQVVKYNDPSGALNLKKQPRNKNIKKQPENRSNTKKETASQANTIKKSETRKRKHNDKKFKEDSKKPKKVQSTALAIKPSTNETKILSLQQRFPRLDIKMTNPPKKSFSIFEIRNHAELLRINRKVFEEFENTLKAVTIVKEKYPILATHKPMMKAVIERKSRRLDEPKKQNMSTDQISTNVGNSQNKHKDFKIVFHGGDEKGLEVATKKQPQKKEILKRVKLRDIIIASTSLKEQKSKTSLKLKEMESDSKLFTKSKADSQDKTRTFLKSASEVSYRKETNRKNVQIHKLEKNKQTFKATQPQQNEEPKENIVVALTTKAKEEVPEQPQLTISKQKSEESILKSAVTSIKANEESAEQKQELTTPKQEREKSRESLATMTTETKKINSKEKQEPLDPSIAVVKRKTPMRRTTKSAMRKQQVYTILPKVDRNLAKKVERRKPKISLLETEEIKIIKAMQRKDGDKNQVVINVVKQVNYTPANKSSSRGERVNVVEWEEEDITKFVNNIFNE